MYCTPGVSPPIVTPTPVPEATPLYHISLLMPSALSVVTVLSTDPAGGFWIPGRYTAK